MNFTALNEVQSTQLYFFQSGLTTGCRPIDVIRLRDITTGSLVRYIPDFDEGVSLICIKLALFSKVNVPFG
jgi:hypothetical protein